MRSGRLACAALIAAGLASRARAADDLSRALDAAGGADVVAFELPSTPGAPHARVAAIVNAAPAAVRAALEDAAHYGLLVPTIVRSEEIGRRADARLIAWELEVPLSNLEGTFELRSTATGVELTFVSGDLAPGRLDFSVAARPDGRATLELDARLDVRRTSWIVRWALARSDVGEAAAIATAAWVAARAVALRAEHPRDVRAFRPTTPIASTPPASVGARALWAAPFTPLVARGAAALVHVAPTGRLAAVSVAAPAHGDARALTMRLTDPRTWHAFPGWKKIVPMPPTNGGPPTVVVEDGLPFVDLDATWTPVSAAGSTRAWTATSGAARGAWFSWDAAPSGGAAALTMSPRLDATGSIPRRFIEAEPLLEHGLALSLAFVDALGATR
ncbi:MAG TPA: hypothetical protein VHJ20_08555 [Polyangia bacterium]|nr:hypothetical protein [Polyangia bacterium]